MIPWFAGGATTEVLEQLSLALKHLSPAGAPVGRGGRAALPCTNTRKCARHRPDGAALEGALWDEREAHIIEDGESLGGARKAAGRARRPHPQGDTCVHRRMEA